MTDDIPRNLEALLMSQTYSSLWLCEYVSKLPYKTGRWRVDYRRFCPASYTKIIMSWGANIANLGNVIKCYAVCVYLSFSMIAMFMAPTWGPSGNERAQMGPMLAPWTLLAG